MGGRRWVVGDGWLAAAFNDLGNVHCQVAERRMGGPGQLT